MASYELGRLDRVANAGPLHLGVCAGGVIDVQLEEVPNPEPTPAPAPSPARGLKAV